MSKTGELQVWWVPQVPMTAFTVPVASLAMGTKLLEVLADYDIFQFEKKLKPDLCNVGGLQRWCDNSDGDGTPGWEDWYDEETGEEDPQTYLMRRSETSLVTEQNYPPALAQQGIAMTKVNVELGDKVRDTVSGYSGICVARTEWLNGCWRMTLQPQALDKDGKPCEAQTFDDFQLEVTEAKLRPVGSKETGGPRDAPVRARDPARV